MKANVQLRDYSDEYTSLGINMADIDAVANTWDVVDGAVDTLVGHIEAHSLGTVVAAKVNQATQAENDARPASAFAQRELGIRFYLRDAVNQKLSFFTIGTADMAIGSIVAGQDELDLSAAPTDTFVTWLEANAQSPDGNAVTVERAVVVGRNS